MNKLQPIETAPKDGTEFLAEIPGYGYKLIYWVDGIVDTDGNECGGWGSENPPQCWTDGICWESNDDGKRSIHPTRWRP